MNRDQALRARQKLIDALPVTGELVRGSLLERTVRHAKGCASCARGEGHTVSVLTVSYPGGRTPYGQKIETVEKTASRPFPA
jgi:hypothetical protein